MYYVCIKIYYREFLSRTASVIKYYLKSLGNFEEVNGTRLFDNLPKNTQQYIIANNYYTEELKLRMLMFQKKKHFSLRAKIFMKKTFLNMLI